MFSAVDNGVSLALRLTFNIVCRPLNVIELFVSDFAVCVGKHVVLRESCELPF